MHVSLTNNSEEVLQEVHEGVYEIGLVTLNEQKLERLCKDYDLECEILMRDEVVGVMSHRVANVEKKAINQYELSTDRLSLYGIDPLEEYREGVSRYISVSNDINFHKNLTVEMNAIVLLPGIAAKQFFNSSKYIILPLKDTDVPLVHAAIYHRTISQENWDVVALIRKALLQS